MEFDLHKLDDEDFEKLVGAVCAEILGVGVVLFSTGPDGGKDGRFEGKAQKYPSSTEPWSGKFIIQCKHTTNSNASCSDSSFDREINDEIPKIKLMIKNKEIDNYLIFTNRKYTAKVGENLRNKIKRETGLKNVEIIGRETLNSLYLSPNPQIIKLFNLNKNIISFDFNENAFKSIIEKLRQTLKECRSDIKLVNSRLEYEFEIINLKKKNTLNNLSAESFDEIMQNSLTYFQNIREFLTSPDNDEVTEAYLDLVSEIRNLITLKRSDFQGFEEIFEFIYQQLDWSDNPNFTGRRFARVLLHYMYFNCDIGKKND